MAVYRVERTRDYTIMSNYHLKDSNLSLKSKGLLSMILSFPDDWNYTLRGLASVCKEGIDAISTGIKELEKFGYIVRRQLRGENGRITDTEYTIYEKPHFLEAPEETSAANPEPDEADVTEPVLPLPHSENPHMAAPYVTKPTELNKERSKTNQSSTNLPKTHSFLPSVPADEPQNKTDGRKEIFEKREEIREQISYDQIANLANREQLDEFVEIMLEVAMTRSPTIRIGRESEYSTAFVQQRFEQLNSTHIQKVLEGIHENTTRVRNTKAYLLAALFNAPSSTDNHYTMLVNHDLNGG